MKLSTIAWAKSSHMIHAIKAHPFNQELMKGSLPRDTFAYYIEQDSHYLQDFSRCHAIIASKAPTPYIRTFLHYADDAFIAEQELVHGFFRKLYDLKETQKMAPATLNYTNYLLRTASLEPVEVAVAAVLPCFWVYREVGLSIAQHSDNNNPYARWIETYSGDTFRASVEEAITIFDELSQFTTDAIRHKMLDAFYKSTCFEWHFWNDAYYNHVFDKLETSPLTPKSTLDIARLTNANASRLF